jgi:DNA-binding CsgD family transcriptional regulator
MRLRRADLESILMFLADVEEHQLGYSPLLLARLLDLIPCAEIVYQEYDHRARRSRYLLGFGPGGPSRWGSANGNESRPDDGDDLYWRAGPCPIVQYRIREHDLGAVRLSDLIPRLRFRELPVYREYFRSLGIDQMLDLGLPDRSLRQRSLILFRAEGDRDFSERDRAVLELLRPHLYVLEAQAALRRRLAEALREQRPCEGNGSVYGHLTRREREVIELVAEGTTNAEIAAQLWVAPSTVKKHLEHIYAKLGVGRRAAVAAMHTRRASGSEAKRDIVLTS